MSWQRRAAMWITGRVFSPAGFYLHIAVYGGWMGWVERAPWPKFLTYISIEAAALVLLVGIGQQAAAEFAEIKANHDFTLQVEELRANTALTQVVHDLVVELHEHRPEGGLR